ncbi:hypothetical protein OQA88_5052 [Cercophora sp. LCS_1]
MDHRGRAVLPVYFSPDNDVAVDYLNLEYNNLLAGTRNEGHHGHGYGMPQPPDPSFVADNSVGDPSVPLLVGREVFTASNGFSTQLLMLSGTSQVDVSAPVQFFDWTSYITGTESTKASSPPVGSRSRSDWARGVDDKIVSLREQHVGFREISEELKNEFGVQISPNALSKRYKKLRLKYLHVSFARVLIQALDVVVPKTMTLQLPEAINNVMPAIMALIKKEVALINRKDFTMVDTRVLDEVVEEFPTAIPQMVQNRLLRKRLMVSGPRRAERAAEEENDDGGDWS